MPTSRSWPEIRRLLQASADRPSFQPNNNLKTPTASEQKLDIWSAAEDNPPFEDITTEAKIILLFVAGFSLVINLLMLVGPIYMMQVYDRVLTSGSVPTLVYLALLAAALLVCSALLEGSRARVLVRLGGRLDELLSARLFARLALPDPSPGNAKARFLRDLETLRNFLTGAGLFFFFDAPWTPLFLAVICILHPLLFAVSFGGALLLFALAVVSELVTRRPLTEAGSHMAAATQFAADVVANADTVEAMGMMAGLRERWLKQWRHGLLLQSVASDRAGLLTATTKFVRPMLQISILGVGAYLALQQKISPGAMVAASIMMGRALAPVEGAIGNWRNFVLARGAYGRIRDVLVSPSRRTSRLPLPRPDGFVSVEQLAGAPPGVERPVVQNVSFRLGAGEALGIVGPSGSGKSTLARFIIGVWRPTSGCARLAGVDVAGWNRSELGPHLGYLSQNIELFDGTIAENIARFGVADSDAIIAAAKKAGVHEMILHMPNGYDTRVGLGGNVLSGGQRQRIGLARALYNNPSLVVLDEPNSNLDGQGEAALLSSLRELKEQGASVILISHRPSVLEAMDKILVLKDGKVAEFGSRQDILWKLRANVAKQSDIRREVQPSEQELSAAATLRSA
jgi:PrtD family type I secretion system ABC transporter